MSQHLRHNQGQSLLEVIVAITIGVLVVTALTFAVIFSLRNASFAKASAQATKLAQEGLELVRTGRDRNTCIINLVTQNPLSWDGNNDQCGQNVGSIWDYQITGGVGYCASASIRCYFTVDTDGALTHIGSYPATDNSLPLLSENITLDNVTFQRAVFLSDDSDDTNYKTQKKATVVVRWTDFAGKHDSILSTILRKL